MTKKVTRQTMKDIISEALLNEFDSPLKINATSVTRKPKKTSRKEKDYEPGHVYTGRQFPEHPGDRGENLHDYSNLSNTGPKRAANKFLFSKQGPTNALTIEDVEALFADASFDNGTSLNSPNKRYSLALVHSEISQRGTPEDKQTWNNSIFAMRANNRSFKARMDAGDFGPNFGYIQGATIPDTKEEKIAAYENNWTAYSLYDKIDPSAAQGEIPSIDPEDASKFQQKRDLFNIDIRNYGSELGTFPPEIQTAMATMFGGVNTLTDRMKQLTEFSSEFQKILSGNNPSADFKQLGLQKMISSVMVMDYFNSIIEDVDSGAGAYMFESFCAAIAGGQVEGKSTTEEGVMGAVDFTLASGASGSSKYYSAIGGIEQAVNGFDDGVPVYYIVAIKDKSSTEEILAINLYSYTVVVDRSDGSNNITIMTPERVELYPKPKAKPGEMVKLNKGSYYMGETSLGQFQILRTSRNDLETFRNAIKDGAQKFEGKIAEVLPKMADIQENSATFSSNLNVYAAGGKAVAGDSAIKSLIQMKELTKQLFDLFHGQAGYEDVESRKLSENKITESMIKNILRTAMESKNV